MIPAFDRRYSVVLGGFLTQFTVIGLLFCFGVFFKEFEEAFGWSRTFLSVCNAVSFLFMGVLAIFAARWNDRFGPRKVLLVAGIVYSIGFLLMSQVGAPWQLFIICAAFFGIGLGTHDVVTLSSVARWFKGRRGIMTGVVKTGTGIGQFVMPPFAAFLIITLEWRGALLVLGGLGFVLLILAALMMQRPPEETEVAEGEVAGIEYGEARLSPAFFKICAAQFLFFPTVATVPLHIVVQGQELGLPQSSAALLLSTVGVSSILGRLMIGLSSDRLGGRKGYILCLSPVAVALFLLLFIESGSTLFLAMALYGFGHGGLFTVVSPTLAEYFGTKAHSRLFGIVVFCGTIGAAIGPILAGYIFDATGSYFTAFCGLLIGILLALILILSLPKRVASGTSA
jgi:MFS family permease